jgi:lipoprotein-anchoring transpeptidase ErfK/SrfK
MMRRSMSLPLYALALTAGLALALCGPAQAAAAGPVSSASLLSASAPPTLTLGSHGPYVRQLQTRLAALHYYPGKADGQFGANTQEAVWAFQEVQRLPVTGNVGPLTWTRLAHPWLPRQLVPSGGRMRVEVFLNRHFLVLYVSSQVRLISHVSTGGGYYYCSPAGGCAYAITPTGNYRTTVYMPGWVTVPLGEMYNPVFFIRTAYAIHGDTYVPLQPVSHGCVRIPMDIAAFFHTLVKTPGTPVYIRKA